jgi:hypothetical protein
LHGGSVGTQGAMGNVFGEIIREERKSTMRMSFQAAVFSKLTDN